MIHIYTVKWGSKYSSDYVNRIFDQCKKAITRNFMFHCITDSKDGIDKNINIIPIPEDNYYSKWWNKMYLFDRSVVTQTGEKLFFDLDIVIQKNINCFVEYDPEDCLVFAKTYWHDMDKMREDTKHIPHRYTDLNSSILRWNDNLDVDSITNLIKSYPEQVFWYYRGIDNFFYHRKIAKIKYFPIGWVYSYNNGYIFPHDIEKHVIRTLPYICIYDSMGRDEDVKF